MTVPLLLLSFVAPPVAVVELPEPGRDRVRFEVVAPLEVRDARAWAAAQVLREVLPKGTDLFTESELFAYVTQMGDPLRVTVAPDHLRIGFSLPQGGMELGAQVISELVRAATLSSSSVESSIAELPFRRRSAWNVGWQPWQTDLTGVGRADVVEIYQRTFRPQNLAVAVAGSFTAGAARAAFERRFANWQTSERTRERGRPGAPPKFDPATYLPLRLVTLEGPVVQVLPRVGEGDEGRPSLAEALVACALLGQGKSSAIFETLREEEAVSYRQEAFLVPGREGLRCRIVFATASEPEEGRCRAALGERISGWSEADRERAIRFAEANVQQDFGLGMLYLNQERPLSESLEDRAFLAAYWKAMSGKPWSWAATFQAMRNVPLVRAKEIAQLWVTRGEWRVAGRR